MTNTTAPVWLDLQAYPFRNRYMDVAPGRRIHYVDEGEGEVILFVHGTPTWSFEWRHCIRELSRNHRCIALDHLGFGLSSRPSDFAYTPEAHAEVLQRFVELLGINDFTLVVHDFGGPIGLPLALQQPGRVRKLVVLNSWMWSIADDAQMARVAKLVGGGFGRFLYRRANFSLRVIMPSAYADKSKLTPAIQKQYHAPFPDADSRGLVLWALAHALLGSIAHYQSLWENRARLGSLPALIIWGTKDPAFKPYQLERWKLVLPHARVVELPVGHWPQEEAPREVVEAIGAFVDGAV